MFPNSYGILAYFDILNQKGVADMYLLLFLIIVLAGSVSVYIFYLKEKKEHLRAIQTGKCPKCHNESITLSDQRGGGCGPKLVSYYCTECGYENSFSVEGSCSL